MTDAELNNLLEAINGWAGARYVPSDEPLPLEVDLSILTDKQWLKLKECINKNNKVFKKWSEKPEPDVKRNNITYLELSEVNIINFSPEAFQSLFNLLKVNNIQGFALKKEPLAEYESYHWEKLFEGIKGLGIKKLGLRLSDFTEMSTKNLIVFFAGLESSKVEELDLSYSFGKASTELYTLFFDKLAVCSNIKSLILAGRDIGATKGPFWEICAKKIIEISIEYLNFNHSSLYKISQDNWINFCKSIFCSKIKNLSLQDNQFFRFNAVQWQWFFEGLAQAKIQTVDIGASQSFKLDEQKWKVFISGLQSTSITSLGYEAIQFKQEQITKIEEVLEVNRQKLLALETNRLTGENPIPMLARYKQDEKALGESYHLKEIRENENVLTRDMPIGLN